MARPTGRPVKEEILAVARPLIQQVGVAGFSYGDLAKTLGIKSPSIHHHFPTKADLVTEVATRYRAEFDEHVAEISSESTYDRLTDYAKLFDATASSGLLCLCGAIAAEWPDISDRPRQEVRLFFASQHRWLVSEIEGGVASGEFRPDLDPAVMAQTFLAALEGSMLMAMPVADPHLAAKVAVGLLPLLVAD